MTSDERPDAPRDEDVGGDIDPTDIRRVRLEKVDQLRAQGLDPYPSRFDVTDDLGELRARFDDLEPGVETETRVRVAGRLMLLRDQGRLVFATLQDRSGSIQLFVSRSVIGEEEHRRFADLDRGDWVGAEGTVMTTRKGELSVKVESFSLLAKSLRPLPDKWHGLSDVDTRYRQRYVDLVVNERARRVLLLRTEIIRSIRRTLDEGGFIEVETPILSLVQGGATARPFATHYNALGIDTFLRIALELHHKRLIVGGLERVYEIGRVFRNEGIDTRHNPEFTMLEAYQAFADFTDMMELTETIISNAARDAIGTTKVQVGGHEVDLAAPWPRQTMADLIGTEVGVEIHPSMPVPAARAVLDGLGLEYEESWGSGRLMAEVFDELVEDDLVGPVFVTHYPVETSPLARAAPEDPAVVERFEVIVGGNELANAYSELNDPVDQLQRFRAEAAAKAAGDLEAGDVDLDYIRALEYGLPPTGGLGIGIDRLVMVLAGVTSIREVILFPTLRPETFDRVEFEP